MIQESHDIFLECPRKDNLAFGVRVLRRTPGRGEANMGRERARDAKARWRCAMHIAVGLAASTPWRAQAQQVAAPADSVTRRLSERRIGSEQRAGARQAARQSSRLAYQRSLPVQLRPEAEHARHREAGDAQYPARHSDLARIGLEPDLPNDPPAQLVRERGRWLGRDFWDWRHGPEPLPLARQALARDHLGRRAGRTSADRQQRHLLRPSMGCSGRPLSR